MIYAICTLGPLEQPNARRYVEIVKQAEELPSFQFIVRDLITDEVYHVHDKQLKLCWMQKDALKALNKR